MTANEWIRMAQIVAWPLVVLILALVYRKELPKLFQALGGKISKVTAVGITLEFASAGPAVAMLQARLDQIRQPSSAGPPPASGVQSLIQLASSAPATDYVVVDLRGGDAWLTSRLYLFATVLPKVLSLRCFVFLADRGPMPQYLLGIASPGSVVSQFDALYPWLRRAMIEAQFQTTVAGEAPYRYVTWGPPSDAIKAELRRLTGGPPVETLDIPRAEALDKITRELVSPIDVMQPGGVESLIQRFLQSPAVRRPHDTNADGSEWVELGSHDEHAQWIKDERQLVDLLGAGLTREVPVHPVRDDEAMVKAVLRKKGEFVALTDAEGRFDRLIDRFALLERIANGV